MLNVWLYELYLRMESKKTKNVASSDIASYIQSDPDIMENLGLDRRCTPLTLNPRPLTLNPEP